MRKRGGSLKPRKISCLNAAPMVRKQTKHDDDDLDVDVDDRDEQAEHAEGGDD